MRTFVPALAFVLAVAVAVSVSGCGAAGTTPQSRPTDLGTAPADAASVPVSDPAGAVDPACVSGTLEPDFQGMPLAGAGLVNGALPKGQYLISTTWLRLSSRPASQQLFGQVMAPILGDLAARDGLLASSLGQSARCGTARTLAVWRDAAAMMAFVTGPAHAAAIASVSTLSRGGSLVTHFADDGTGASWAHAAAVIGTVNGPTY
jgi:hypothetical protein